MCIEDVHIVDWDTVPMLLKVTPLPPTLEIVRGFSVKFSRDQITEKPDYL